MPGKILIADDDKSIHLYTVCSLPLTGWQAQEARFNQVALGVHDTFDGLMAIRQTKTHSPQTDTVYASVDSAEAAIRQEAFDYLRKPVDTDKIIICVNLAPTHQRTQKISILVDEPSALSNLPQTKLQSLLLPQILSPNQNHQPTLHQDITKLC